ncbi:MAG: glycosyltransferase family 2 protein [Candidatus Daviesbacteria bacterium]|nr:glycosyltransferase family 2 protein [Candidatus Daviesbacteria bacterium]
MISAIVLTRNEEDRINSCLESIKWVDEIIVVDSNSQDKTVEMAEKLGAKVYKREFDNYVNQKEWAFSKTSGDWVIYVDADERVLELLKQEILDLISKDEYSAYAISRRNIIFGQEEKYGPFWPDWVIRLIKRDNFIKWVGEVHEHMEFKGKLGYTKNSLLHLTHRDVEHVILKNLQWSKIDAVLRLKANHPKMSSWRFLRILFSELFNQGIIRRGFFSGTVGTIDAILQTFSMVTTYIRLWEDQQPKPLEEVYKEIDQKLINDNFKY